jgi:D-alanyl-lipoteichoic acid acyltransferase DltB (MBOAT superfamily)
MLFNSYIFIFFMMPLSIMGYYLLGKKKDNWSKVWLLICSFVFIAYLNPLYLVVLIPSICFNYFIAKLMNTPDRKANRKSLLATGVAADVITLLIFKYTGFFIETVNEILDRDSVEIKILLPLGISFYTFQQITFLVDYYRDETLNCSLLEYALFISFYPQFVQGPIVLQSELIPQFRDEDRRNCDYEYMARGLYRFILGLAKKVLIADGIAVAINIGYIYLSKHGTLSTILLILGYSLQIYFDFSGYTDMAIGLGWMFHINLPENFDSPYKAGSIEEFWDRWHITLTRFFTRYVYIPLGGSRKGRARTYFNIMFIFLLSGLWHGSDISFVIWGLMHGIGMLFCRGIRGIKKSRSKNEISSENRIIRVVKTGITFIYVSAAWVFFRAPDCEKAVRVFTNLFDTSNMNIAERMIEKFDEHIEITMLLRLDPLNINDRFHGVWFMVALILVLCACLFLPNTKQMTDRFKDSIIAVTGYKRVITYGLMTVLFFWSILSMSGVSEFVYWSF